MRIIFMGTPDFSVPVLKALMDNGHEVVLAVTQPDKQRGRGKKVTYSPVKEEALARDIPVFQPKKIREEENIEFLKKYEADVMVVVAFGQILPKAILEMTPYGCINVHASLLPKYRGAAPIQWAVLEGEKVSGVTIMQMDEGLDTGDMLLKKEVELTATETYESLHDKLSPLGAEALIETLKQVEEGEVKPVPQGETPTPYARMIEKEMGNIDWCKDAIQVDCLIRGLNPWPSAYTMLEDKVMKVWKGEVLTEDLGKSPGEIVRVDKDGLVVQTGKGCIKITELQVPGKKRMLASAFLLGYKVPVHTVLTQ